mmetsp:Transcript_38336/g.59477  ORF Transcript_38336/g.59477 Transcript_38336/m.59477 type:complete len:96 (+) Transcript_38336:887-1174(+)
MLAGTGLGEEGVEGIITTTNGLVGRHLAIRLDTVLKAVKLPAGITGLDTGLTAVDGNALTHFGLVEIKDFERSNLVVRVRTRLHGGRSCSDFFGI